MIIHQEKRLSSLDGREDSLRTLTPLCPVVRLDATGPVKLMNNLVAPEAVGWKAYGLASLPSEWVPKFLIINANCFEHSVSEAEFTARLRRALSEVGVNSSVVMLRSSGTAETIEHRGRLTSGQSPVESVFSTVRQWMSQLPKPRGGSVHWIAQECVESKRKGQLSNERHVSKEKRDWVAEVELHVNQPGYVIHFGIRRWRGRTKVSDFALNCKSEAEISFCLKRVAMWAERLAARMHFEWVWNGFAIRIVQADEAAPRPGVNPHVLLPSHVPTVAVESLSTFRVATPRHYGRYRKLLNVRLYESLGYQMPVFFLLEAQEILTTIIEGGMPKHLEHDLVELTKRPLILRTDGENVPFEKQEMLPRSDELRTAAQARKWLLSDFRNTIRKSKLQHARLCLIGHHFIPSIASAWARAEPRERLVRIEALWGVPEGLYWYAHDTFEVDTQEVDMSAQKSNLNYKAWQRLRYKRTFVAADGDGRWVPQQTVEPFDWRPTIRKKQWLFEIAESTRRIAKREKHPTTVMWLIGNHKEATPHEILPWYHGTSELETTPKAAPRRKLRSAQDVKIQSTSDWDRLKARVAAGSRVERVIVEPLDCELIRDRKFTDDLAKFAASNRIVIELAGGVLTHAYYILQREGAQVEFTDLFGADEEIVEFNKLVRDKIPAIIRSRGERGEVARLEGDALLAALRSKLVEEAFEALDAKQGHDIVGELADVEEVVASLRKALRIEKVHVETERRQKRMRRGGFDKGYMLLKTARAHSLQRPRSAREATLKLSPNRRSDIVISDPTNIPASPIYRRPDLRVLEQHLEKLFVFEAEATTLTNLTEAINFSLPIKGDEAREFTLTVEIRRSKSVLRTDVRLQLRPSQRSIPFPDDNQLTIPFPSFD